MSLEALTWAMQQKPRTATEKLVLLSLADHHNRSTGRCDPSMVTIAEEALCSKRQAIRCIESLELQGFVRSMKTNGSRTRYMLQTPPTGDIHVTGDAHVTGDTDVTGSPESGDTHDTGHASTGDTHVTGAVTPVSPEPGSNQELPPLTPPGGKSRSSAPSVTARRIREDFPDVPTELASEFLAYRKRKAPLTETAWARMAAEIRKSGLDPPDALGECMARGWRGFKASWVTGDDDGRRPNGGKQRPADRVRRAWEQRFAQDR